MTGVVVNKRNTGSNNSSGGGANSGVSRIQIRRTAPSSSIRNRKQRRCSLTAVLWIFVVGIMVVIGWKLSQQLQQLADDASRDQEALTMMMEAPPKPPVVRDLNTANKEALKSNSKDNPSLNKPMTQDGSAIANPTRPLDAATSNNNIAINSSPKLTYNSPIPPNATLRLPPPKDNRNHRYQSKHVIFSFARGYQHRHYALFLGSLRDAGFDGDVVLGVEPNMWGSDLQHILSFPNVLVYEIVLDCEKVGRNKLRTHCTVPQMFASSSSSNASDAGEQQYLPDSRPPREAAQLRFEYYWAWSTHYSSDTQIFLLDCRDVVFQRHQNPFAALPADIQTQLFVFEESRVETIGSERSNRRWIKQGHGEEALARLKDLPIVCSGTTAGGQPAINMYTRAMIQQFDETHCVIYGCDQGHHNYLVGMELLEGVPNITAVTKTPQGQGIVNTIGLLVNRQNTTMRELGLQNTETGLILNNDGSVPAIVHQFDRDPRLVEEMDSKAETYKAEWRQIRAELRQQSGANKFR